MPKVCRTCLKQITSTDFISFNDSIVIASLNSIVKQELAICIPELDLNLIVNPIVCNSCVNDLHAAYDFKRKCLQSEERIRTYIQSNPEETSSIDIGLVIGCYNENETIEEFHGATNVKIELPPQEYDEDSDSYGNALHFDSNLDCKIKTDSIPTVGHSKEDSLNGGFYSEQDCVDANETAAEYLPEVEGHESEGEGKTNEIKAVKYPPYNYGTSENRRLSDSHIDQSTTSLNVTPSKRRTFTMEDKVDIIKMLESGIKMAEVCRKTGLATSTVCCIMKRKDVILNAFEKNGINMKRLRKPRHADVDEALLSWCKQQQSMNVILSGPLLKVKAEELARTIGNYDFACTNGWLERFRIRYNISVGKRSREAVTE